MGLFAFLSRWKRGSSTMDSNGMSRCRHFVCPKCNSVYDKSIALNGWRLR